MMISPLNAWITLSRNTLGPAPSWEWVGINYYRDQIWSRLRFPFDADFRFYEAHGMFDFPQNDTRYLEFSQQMIKMIQDPQMREMVRKMIKTEMIKGYQKVVETK